MFFFPLSLAFILCRVAKSLESITGDSGDTVDKMTIHRKAQSHTLTHYRQFTSRHRVFGLREETGDDVQEEHANSKHAGWRQKSNPQPQSYEWYSAGLSFLQKSQLETTTTRWSIHFLLHETSEIDFVSFKPRQRCMTHQQNGIIIINAIWHRLLIICVCVCVCSMGFGV